jgi:hypothetical protein
MTQCFLRRRNWITSHITSNQYVFDMDLKLSVKQRTYVMENCGEFYAILLRDWWL